MDYTIRWKQRFQNFEKAYNQLVDAIEQVNKNDENSLLKSGLIQTYEYTFELAWKTLKDYLESEGFDVPSPKKTLRQAFQNGIIKEGERWIQALDDRNKTAHLYEEAVANEIVADVINNYFNLIRDLYFELKKEL